MHRYEGPIVRSERPGTPAVFHNWFDWPVVSLVTAKKRSSRKHDRSQLSQRIGIHNHFPSFSSIIVTMMDDYTILPEDFVPSDYDVICGWARQNYNHGKRLS